MVGCVVLVVTLSRVGLSGLGGVCGRGNCLRRYVNLILRHRLAGALLLNPATPCAGAPHPHCFSGNVPRRTRPWVGKSDRNYPVWCGSGKLTGTGNFLTDQCSCRTERGRILSPNVAIA